MLLLVSRLPALGMSLFTCPCVSARATAKRGAVAPVAEACALWCCVFLRAPASSLAGQANARGCGPLSVVSEAALQVARDAAAAGPALARAKAARSAA